jgi:hypothetical protein
LRINRCRSHLKGKPLRQPRNPGDIEGLFTDLRDAATHDLIHIHRVKTRALKRCNLNLAQQISRL